MAMTALEAAAQYALLWKNHGCCWPNTTDLASHFGCCSLKKARPNTLDLASHFGFCSHE